MDIHILLRYFSSDRDFQRVDLSVCVCTRVPLTNAVHFFHYFAIVCFIVPWCPSVHRAIHIIIYFRPDLSTCIVCRCHIVLLWSILIYIHTYFTNISAPLLQLKLELYSFYNIPLFSLLSLIFLFQQQLHFLSLSHSILLPPFPRLCTLHSSWFFVFTGYTICMPAF